LMRHFFFSCVPKMEIIISLPMVNHRISPDLKECALRLWDAGWDGRIYVLLSWCLMLVYFAGEPSLTHSAWSTNPLHRSKVGQESSLERFSQLYINSMRLQVTFTLMSSSGGLLSIMILSSVV